MRWLAGLLALFIAAPAYAGTWTIVPGSDFVCQVDQATIDQNNLGGNCEKIVPSYSGTRYGPSPGGTSWGVYYYGGGHKAWYGNQVQFWDRATNTQTLLIDPSYFNDLPHPTITGGKIAYDYDLDGQALEVPPAQHNRDGGEIVMNSSGLPHGFVTCGSGPSSRGDSSTDPNSRPWVLDFGNMAWDNQFVNSGLGLNSGNGCKTWVNPNQPTRAYFLREREQYGWIDPEAGTQSIGSVSGITFDTKGFGAGAWVDDGADGFALICSKPNKCAKIVTDVNGENPQGFTVNVTTQPVDLNGRKPLSMNSAAWVSYFLDDGAGPVPVILATHGEGGVWRCDWVGNDLDCALVVGLGPKDPSVEPTRSGLPYSTPDGVEADLHVTETNELLYVAHTGEIWMLDMDGGTPPPPPDPVCTVTNDGAVERTVDPCDPTEQKLNDAAAALGPSASIGPSEGVVWVGDGFHDFTGRNVKRIEVRADATNVVIYGATIKGVRGSNPPIASELGKSLARFG